MYSKGGLDHMHEKIRLLSEFTSKTIHCCCWTGGRLEEMLGKEHVIIAVPLRKWLLI